MPVRAFARPNRLGMLIALSCACAAGEADRRAEISGWRSQHKLAASQLCDFVHQYPTDASRLRGWLQGHPLQAKQLLEWGAENGWPPPPELFQSQPGLTGYRPWQDPGAYILYDWAATNRDAARALAQTPHAVEWALDARNCGE